MTREEAIAKLDAHLKKADFYQPVELYSPYGDEYLGEHPTRRRIDGEIDLGEIVDLLTGAK